PPAAPLAGLRRAQRDLRARACTEGRPKEAAGRLSELPRAGSPVRLEFPPGRGRAGAGAGAEAPLAPRAGRSLSGVRASRATPDRLLPHRTRERPATTPAREVVPDRLAVRGHQAGG